MADFDYNTLAAEHGQALYHPVTGVVATATSPFDYHMRGTADMATRLSNELKRSGHPIASGIFDFAAPAGALITSPIYDAMQAYQRMESGSGISGFWDAYKSELPGTSGRFVGASAPLSERLSNWKNNFGFTQAHAGENKWIQNKRAQRFKQQQLMNRRKQDMQQRIRQGEAAEAAKKNVITTGGPPGGGDPGMTYTAPVTTGGPPGGGDPGMTYTAPSAVTTAKGPPSILSRPPPSAPTGTGGPPSQGGGGGGPPSQGGGSPQGGGSSRGRGRNPWGRADGGLINFYRHGGFI